MRPVPVLTALIDQQDVYRRITVLDDMPFARLEDPTSRVGCRVHDGAASTLVIAKLLRAIHTLRNCDDERVQIRLPIAYADGAVQHWNGTLQRQGPLILLTWTVRETAVRKRRIVGPVER